MRLACISALLPALSARIFSDSTTTWGGLVGHDRIVGIPSLCGSRPSDPLSHCHQAVRAREAGLMASTASPTPKLPELEAALEAVRLSADNTWMRIKRAMGGESTQDSKQPALVGKWTKTRTDNMDSFLDLAMGVPYLKRRLALGAKQTQRLWVMGRVVHVEIRDARGAKTYLMYPDGQQRQGKGFMGMPIKQRVRWNGEVLEMVERYETALGGAEHGSSPARATRAPWSARLEQWSTARWWSS